MRRDYQTLLELLTTHRADFYELLLRHHEAILKATLQKPKHAVAKDLNISPAKFSTIYTMLIAYSMLLERDSNEPN